MLLKHNFEKYTNTASAVAVQFLLRQQISDNIVKAENKLVLSGIFLSSVDLWFTESSVFIHLPDLISQNCFTVNGGALSIHQNNVKTKFCTEGFLCSRRLREDLECMDGFVNVSFVRGCSQPVPAWPGQVCSSPGHWEGDRGCLQAAGWSHLSPGFSGDPPFSSPQAQVRFIWTEITECSKKSHPGKCSVWCSEVSWCFKEVNSIYLDQISGGNSVGRILWVRVF